MNHSTLQLTRRDLLATAATVGAASVLTSSSVLAESAPVKQKIVDTNVNLFQWPFRRLPLDETAALVNKLRSLGIFEAWAGSFEGLLHRDISGVNQRLTDECKQYPELIPIGSINPELPGWEDDLNQCVHKHDIPGIRLHPNYHGYSLDDPRFFDLLKRATAAGLFVQIAASMEDGRTQHPLVQVPDVDLAPLSKVMKEFPDVSVQLLNYKPRLSMLTKLAAIPNVTFDIARVDGSGGIAKMLETVPSHRVMVGTHAPFFIPEAVLIRILESSLSEEDLHRLLSGNAQSLGSSAFLMRRE